MTTRPERVLIDAALDALRPCSLELERNGWPVKVGVSAALSGQGYVVSLYIELPPFPATMEASRDG